MPELAVSLFLVIALWAAVGAICALGDRDWGAIIALLGFTAFFALIAFGLAKLNGLI